jgi:hypothetical protein
MRVWKAGIRLCIDRFRHWGLWFAVDRQTGLIPDSFRWFKSIGPCRGDSSSLTLYKVSVEKKWRIHFLAYPHRPGSTPPTPPANKLLSEPSGSPSSAFVALACVRPQWNPNTILNTSRPAATRESKVTGNVMAGPLSFRREWPNRGESPARVWHVRPRSGRGRPILAIGRALLAGQIAQRRPKGDFSVVSYPSSCAAFTALLDLSVHSAYFILHQTHNFNKILTSI